MQGRRPDRIDVSTSQSSHVLTKRHTLSRADSAGHEAPVESCVGSCVKLPKDENGRWMAI